MSTVEICFAALAIVPIMMIVAVISLQNRVKALEDQALGIPKGFDADDWFCYTTSTSIRPGGQQYVRLNFEADSWFLLLGVAFELRAGDSRYVTCLIEDPTSGRYLFSGPCELAYAPQKIERGKIFHPASAIGILFNNDCLDDAFVRVVLTGRKLFRLYSDADAGPARLSAGSARGTREKADSDQPSRH